jgi:hypothetical protein
MFGSQYFIITSGLVWSKEILLDSVFNKPMSASTYIDTPLVMMIDEVLYM